jgi:predicted MFS family arabinose efflux permease
MRLSLSVWSCFLPAGAAIIMLLAPVLMMRFGWRGVWLVNALILSGYAVLLARSTRPAASTDPQQSDRGSTVWKDVVRTATSPGPILLATIFSTYTLQWLAMMGFLPMLLIEDHGFSPGQASLLTAVVVAANVPGNLSGGWLLHRGFLRWRLVASAMTVMGICGVFIYSATLPFLVRYTACLVFSGVGGLVPASILGGAPIYAPTPKLVATTNGLIMQGSQLGQTVGPPVLALIVSATGTWESAPWLLCSAAALGICLSFGLGALGKKME